MAGEKHDEGKQRWHSLPLEILEPLADLMEAGRKKYGKFNCLDEFDNPDERFWNANMRHAAACQRDPLARDPETGCYHEAARAFSSLMRIYHCLREAKREAEAMGFSLPPLNDGDDDPIVHVVPDRTSRNIAPTGVMIEQSEADLNRDLARADAMLEFARLQRLPEEKIIAEIEKQHRDEIAKIEREHLVHVVTDRTSRSGEVEASDWRPCPND